MTKLDHRRALIGARLAELGFEFTGYDGKTAAVFRREGVAGTVRLPSSPRFRSPQDQTKNALLRARKLMRRAGANNHQEATMPKPTLTPTREESRPLILAALGAGRGMTAPDLWAEIAGQLDPPSMEQPTPTWFHQHLLALEKQERIRRDGLRLNEATGRHVAIWWHAEPQNGLTLVPQAEIPVAAEPEPRASRLAEPDSLGAIRQERLALDGMEPAALLSELARRLEEPAAERDTITETLVDCIDALNAAGAAIDTATQNLAAALELMGGES